MFTTRSNRKSNETPERPATERRVNALSACRQAFVDLEFDMPWLGPSPHWVPDSDGTRLRTSLVTRGYRVYETNGSLATTPADFLADLTSSLGMSPGACFGWNCFADALGRLADESDSPLALVWMNPAPSFAHDLPGTLRNFVSLTCAVEHLNSTRNGRAPVTLVFQGETWNNN